MAEGQRPRLKGGGVFERDQWYGLEASPDFAAFRRWWHRVGKHEYGRDDIKDRAAAEDVHSEWVASGRPQVK